MSRPKRKTIPLSPKKLTYLLTNAAQQVENNTALLRQYIVFQSLIMKKLGLTKDDLEEEKATIIDQYQKRATEMLIQSEGSRPDEDSGRHAEPNVLPTESSGES